jgi:hypothetical protein
MKIIIEPGHGGASVIVDDGENEDRSIYHFTEENLDGLQSLFYELDEMLISTGRYSHYRMTHNIVHGDKYQCRGCDWCKGAK